MEPERRRAALPFAVLGVVFVVIGGLVAAATAPVASEHGSWAAAYLVLVAGVSQAGLGVGQAMLARRVPSRRVLNVELVTWNVGNAAVIAGTLLETTSLVDVGGVVLLVTLALMIRAVRGGGAATAAEAGAVRPAGWMLLTFRILVLVLLVTIPIGLVLARIGPT
ncbi:MAG TPA: hypothetical protein VIS06_11330 [Mycobacteriales bacterium]